MVIQDYSRYTTEALMDMLAEETSKITQLMLENKFDEEYESSKEAVKNIQAVLTHRKTLMNPQSN